MRLPMNGKDVDIETTKEMVDYFIDNGFNYLIFAYGYLDGKLAIESRKHMKLPISTINL